MIVKTGNLPDLGHRQTHPGRQRGEVARRKVVVRVLKAMQIFDQQVAARCLRTKKSLDFGKGGRVCHPALRLVIPAPPAGFATLLTV